jgi:lysophospholipase L1-like esterase
MESSQLFQKKFVFGPHVEKDGALIVTKDHLFTPEAGYGFVTEEVAQRDEQCQIPEINNGFTEKPQNEVSIGILMGDAKNHASGGSFCCSVAPDIPLYFRVKVPHAGNYRVELLLGADGSETDVTVFSERRRCVLRKARSKRGLPLKFSFTANVCNIIPRGKQTVYCDGGIDITILGKSAHLNAIAICETPESHTIYIAGDSTVTDQTAEYPYVPGESYCGWGQMLPAFFKEGIAVSNHAHSGLTTTGFLEDGHWDIVASEMKRGDYLLVQFGHNDQKDKNLAAFGGYAKYLEKFIEMTRARGVHAVLITPVSRSLWNAPDGEFNDLLTEWAEACRSVAHKTGTPLIDLHERSMEFILEQGRENSLRYFYPNDYTHFNDFGGYLMAAFVAQELRKVKLSELSKFLRNTSVNPEEILEGNYIFCRKSEKKPALRKTRRGEKVPAFQDVGGLPEKEAIQESVRRGILRGDGNLFHPDTQISRAEFLSSVFAAFQYLPKNVYNDVYSDVFGDEWYAGTIQAAFDNQLIDGQMTADGRFSPQKAVNFTEALSVLLRILESKYGAKLQNVETEASQISEWEKAVIANSQQLSICKGVDDGKNSILHKAQVAKLIMNAVEIAAKLLESETKVEI